MNKLIATAAIIATILSTPLLAADDDRAEWLFVQSADGVELVGDTTLVFPVEREIFAFTDRPYRKHHYLNAHEFVAIWSEGEDSFGDDPPNAVLTWVEEGEVQELDVELLDARVGDHGRVIHYDIALEEEASGPGEGMDAALYIDTMANQTILMQRRWLEDG